MQVTEWFKHWECTAGCTFYELYNQRLQPFHIISQKWKITEVLTWTNIHFSLSRHIWQHNTGTMTPTFLIFPPPTKHKYLNSFSRKWGMFLQALNVPHFLSYCLINIWPCHFITKTEDDNSVLQVYFPQWCMFPR